MRATPLAGEGDARKRRHRAPKGPSDGLGHGPLDAQKQTIDNSVLSCYDSTIVTCIFVNGELTDIKPVYRYGSSPHESASHLNMNVMYC